MNVLFHTPGGVKIPVRREKGFFIFIKTISLSLYIFLIYIDKSLSLKRMS